MFSIRHTDGTAEMNPPLESLSILYDELLIADEEHGDVSVKNQDSGWCISAHGTGQVILSKLSDLSAGFRHMMPVEKSHVLKLWKLLIAGDMERLLSEPWKPGYAE